MQRSPQAETHLQFILLAAVFGLLTSCGIPSTPYIAPVPEDTVASRLGSDPQFSFGVPTSNNSEIFEGFEIYYKFYAPNATVSPDIESDTLTSPISHFVLESAGFRRLYASDDSSEELPLISLFSADKTDPDLRLILDFTNAYTEFPHSPYDPDLADPAVNEIYFGRLLQPDPVAQPDQFEYKAFFPADFIMDDVDLPSGFDPTLYNSIHLSLFVLAYGNDFSSLEFDIHSVAVYLGWIDISLIP